MPTSILSLRWFVCLCASTITVCEDSRETDTIRNETIKHLPTQGSNWACSLRQRMCHLFIPWCSQSVLCFLTGPCCAPTPRTNLSCLSHLISSLVLWDRAYIRELSFFSKNKICWASWGNHLYQDTWHVPLHVLSTWRNFQKPTSESVTEFF